MKNKEEEYFNEWDKLILYGMGIIFSIVGVHIFLIKLNLWEFLGF
jgi:hypothetical protein